MLGNTDLGPEFVLQQVEYNKISDILFLHQINQTTCVNPTLKVMEWDFDTPNLNKNITD